MIVLPDKVAPQLLPPDALTLRELPSTMNPAGTITVADLMSWFLLVEGSFVKTIVNGLVVLPAATDPGEIVASYARVAAPLAGETIPAARPRAIAAAEMILLLNIKVILH
jgi:hypothetical protein